MATSTTQRTLTGPGNKRRFPVIGSRRSVVPERLDPFRWESLRIGSLGGQRIDRRP
jgi:hypothetical protein